MGVYLNVVVTSLLYTAIRVIKMNRKEGNPLPEELSILHANI